MYQNDPECRHYKIVKVSPQSDGHFVSFSEDSHECDGTIFVPDSPLVTPEVGMSITLYGQPWGGIVRGIFVNNIKVFYRTPEEESSRFRQEVIAREEKKKSDFEKNKDSYFSRIAELPEVFRERIKKFQTTNPNYDWNFGEYELFCCEQAVEYAKALGSAESLAAWNKLPLEEQKKLVPAFDAENHSGNTQGCAVRLAYYYLTDKANVVREHGALTPLVGCEAYGCPHGSL